MMVAVVGALVAAQGMAEAVRLETRGDTNAAIAAYEAHIRRHGDDTEARWRVGRLYLSRHRAGSQLSENRRRAEEHLRYAARLQPDSAKHWLALARLFRTYTEVTLRVQVPGLQQRAYEVAATDTAALPDAAYYQARLAWERYEHLKGRWLFNPQILAINPNDPRGSLLHMRPDPDDPGAAQRLHAEGYLREAIAGRPDFVDAVALLVVLLQDAERHDEALNMARQLVRVAPENGYAWTLVGLSLTRLERWREAERAFARALGYLSPSERAPYLALDAILREADARRLADMVPELRARLGQLYWQERDPLFLTDVNETRVEFFARMTLAMHRWSDPERGVLGHLADRGIVYIRYGPPDRWLTTGRGRGQETDPVGEMESHRNQVVWFYDRTQMHFIFTMQPGYARTAFGGDFRALYQEVSNVHPVRFDNVPVVREMDTIEIQTVQFRGSPNATDVALFGFIPVGRMVDPAGDLAAQVLETLVLVRDSTGHRHADIRDIDSVHAGEHPVAYRRWRRPLVPMDYLLRAEAQLPTTGRAARSTGMLRVAAFPERRFAVSDVLVARRLAPRDSVPRRWTDFFIEPSAGRVTPGDPVSLLWETYDLATDPTGVARWRVSLRVTVTSVERRSVSAVLMGSLGDAIGASALGDEPINLTWDREGRPGPDGTTVEFVTLDFADAPAGTYEITVVVTDRLSGLTVERTRTLTRSELEPARR